MEVYGNNICCCLQKPVIKAWPLSKELKQLTYRRDMRAEELSSSSCYNLHNSLVLTTSEMSPMLLLFVSVIIVITN